MRSRFLTFTENRFPLFGIKRALTASAREDGRLRPYVFAGYALRRLLLGLDQLAVDQALGDLDGVERGALAQVVGDDPQHEAVLDRRVLADAADIGRVLARAFVR